MARAAPRISRDLVQWKRRPSTRLRPRHRAWIATLPCVKCGRRPCDAAHVRVGTDGGTSLKPSDRYCLPLCRRDGSREGCHAEQHRRGEQTFWSELGIDPVDTALRLWTVTGDDEAGLRAVERAHQAIRLHKG